nr:1,5-anhydro-D-fructose reductase [Halyomorpha halys]
MSSKLTNQSVLTSGTMKMPVIGLGTWQSHEREIGDAVAAAIEAGYRHIDTAYIYLNEEAIGNTLQKAFKDGKIKREDLFITTKLPNVGNRAEEVETFLKESLEYLQLDYVDLYLIHSPVGFVNDGTILPRDESGTLLLDLDTDIIELWKGMEAQVDAGRAKNIGLSNFNINQIQRILDNCRIPPANLQVELHIYFQQNELVSFCKKNGITVCAYAPLGSPNLIQFNERIGIPTDGIKNLSPMTDTLIMEIAKKYGKTPSQVLLRFLIQYGVAVIPKSINPERIKQNLDVFDFELSDEEFKQIRALDRGEEGRMFGASGIFAAMIKHPEYPFPK